MTPESHRESDNGSNRQGSEELELEDGMDGKRQLTKSLSPLLLLTIALLKLLGELSQGTGPLVLRSRTPSLSPSPEMENRQREISLTREFSPVSSHNSYSKLLESFLTSYIDRDRI